MEHDMDQYRADIDLMTAQLVLC